MSELIAIDEYDRKSRSGIFCYYITKLSSNHLTLILGSLLNKKLSESQYIRMIFAVKSRMIPLRNFGKLELIE